MKKRGRHPIPIMKHPELLWDKVTKTESCWIWRGALWGKRKMMNYGIITNNYKRYLTHRLAWIFTNGPILNGLCVLHKCDNPQCVNPTHLWLGTLQDNNRDRDLKGRQRPGRYGKPGTKKRSSHGGRYPYIPVKALPEDQKLPGPDRL